MDKEQIKLGVAYSLENHKKATALIGVMVKL